MRIIVDGDNAPGANIIGMNMLGPEDSVYIYYASDNKYFRRTDKQEAIIRTAKCPLTFTSIPASSNAVDFAIAMDLKAIIESCPSEVVAIVSDDKHFRTILNRAKNITQSSSIYQVSDIEEAVKRYKMLEITSLQDLHKYLSRSFGQEMGCEFYGKVDKLFAQKYQSKTAQISTNVGEERDSEKTRQVTEKLKARLTSAWRGAHETSLYAIAHRLTAGFVALLRL